MTTWDQNDCEVLVRRMTALDSGLQIKDHIYFFTLYPSCVTGKQISDWLVQKGVVSNKFGSIEVGQALLNFNCILSLTKSKKFAPDNSLFYRFTKDLETARKLSAVWKSKPEVKKKMQETQEILQRLKDPKTGLHVKDRSYLFYKYPACFDGKSLVTWLVDNQCFSSRKEALDFGIYMLNENLIYHVSRDKPFTDSSSYFYRFTDTQLTNMEELKKISQDTMNKLYEELYKEIKLISGTYYFRTYQSVFLGKTLVAWILENRKDLANSEQAAIDLADKLLTNNKISVVPSSLRIPKFTIERDLYYRFDKEPQRIKVVDGSKELEMTQIFEQMKAPSASAIEVKDVRTGLKKISDAFTGSAAVSWIMAHTPYSTRSDAIGFADMAWKEGFLRSTSDHMFFDSDEVFFKFGRINTSKDVYERSSLIESGQNYKHLMDSSMSIIEEEEESLPQRGWNFGRSSVRNLRGIIGKSKDNNNNNNNNSKKDDKKDDKSFQIPMEWYCPVGADRCIRLPRDEVNKLKHSGSFKNNRDMAEMSKPMPEEDPHSSQETVSSPSEKKTPAAPEILDTAVTLLNNGGYGFSDWGLEPWEKQYWRNQWVAAKLTPHEKRTRAVIDELDSFNDSRDLSAKIWKHPELPKQYAVVSEMGDLETLKKRQEVMSEVNTRWATALPTNFGQTLSNDSTFQKELEKSAELKKAIKNEPVRGKHVSFGEANQEITVVPFYGAANVVENGRHIVTGALSAYLTDDSMAKNAAIQKLSDKQKKIVREELIEAFESIRVPVPVYINGKAHHEDEMLITQYAEQHVCLTVIEELSKYLDSDNIIEQKGTWKKDLTDLVETAMKAGARALFE